MVKKRILPVLIALLFFQISDAQEMTVATLKAVIGKVGTGLKENGHSVQFRYKGKSLLCIYDEYANRMRILTPVIERERISEEQLLNALVANFHSALDVRYALSDEVIWSVFIHPLNELSEHQVVDGIAQVAEAAATFGTTYSSSDLFFPGNAGRKERPVPKRSF